MTSISPAALALLAGMVEEHAGLHYQTADHDLFAARITTRVVERGFESPLDYYYFLRYDPEGRAELEQLVESLVVQETYFFRELGPLVALVDLYLAPRIAAGQRPRVWCAAAATGEEPLTLAMLLADRGLLDRVELWASDISARALEHARRGQFGRRSLRNTTLGYQRWLRIDGDRARIDPALVEAIHWERCNLNGRLDEAWLAGGFDAILCRNVLIYFDQPTVTRVVEGLSALLRPAAVLLVGVSESLFRLGTLLRCEERGGAFFYEKALP